MLVLRFLSILNLKCYFFNDFKHHFFQGLFQCCHHIEQMAWWHVVAFRNPAVLFAEFLILSTRILFLPFQCGCNETVNRFFLECWGCGRNWDRVLLFLFLDCILGFYTYCYWYTLSSQTAPFTQRTKSPHYTFMMSENAVVSVLGGILMVRRHPFMSPCWLFSSLSELSSWFIAVFARELNKLHETQVPCLFPWSPLITCDQMYEWSHW